MRTRPLVSSLRDIRILHSVHGRHWPRLRQVRHLPRVLSAGEHRLLRVCTLVAVAGVVWLGASFVGRHRITIPAIGGSYSEAVVGSPQLVNPLFSPINDVDQDLANLIFTGLMRYDKNQELLPDLAESYTVSQDKKKYTFILRKNVVWHDGQPFTSKDVLFTIQTIQNQGVGSPLWVSFQGVAAAAPDAQTVTLTLPEPFALFLGSLTTGILPEHKWFDVTPERLRLHKNNLQPIGTGPYMFKKLSKDDSGQIHTFELTRFDKFYRAPAYIKDFTFRFFSEYEGPSGAISALRSQKADGLNFVPHDLRSKVERKHIRLHILQLPQYTALFFNEARSILKDSRVREAVSKAIDKERILREALKGDGQIIHSPILPGFLGYSPAIAKTGYNMDEASMLLDKDWVRISSEEYRKKRIDIRLKEREAEVAAVSTSTAEFVTDNGATTTLREAVAAQVIAEVEAGMNPAQTFYRQNKVGTLLELTILTVDTPEYKQAAGFIAGNAEEIGVKTTIQFVDAKDLSRTVLKGRNYDMLLYGVILGSDADQYAFWHSSQIDFPGLNLSSYVNRNVDALLKELRETDNEEKIIELTKKFQDVILSDRPAVFLYMPTYTYATADVVKGVDVARIFYPSDRFANVTEWYVKTDGKWK